MKLWIWIFITNWLILEFILPFTLYWNNYNGIWNFHLHLRFAVHFWHLFLNFVTSCLAVFILIVFFTFSLLLKICCFLASKRANFSSLVSSSSGKKIISLFVVSCPLEVDESLSILLVLFCSPLGQGTSSMAFDSIPKNYCYFSHLMYLSRRQLYNW